MTTKRRTYNPSHKDQVFATLRREILAARLKVTLDEQLKRETSPTVKALSQMKLPPSIKVYYDGETVKVEGGQTSRPKAMS